MKLLPSSVYSQKLFSQKLFKKSVNVKMEIIDLIGIIQLLDGVERLNRLVASLILPDLTAASKMLLNKVEEDLELQWSL